MKKITISTTMIDRPSQIRSQSLLLPIHIPIRCIEFYGGKCWGAATTQPSIIELSNQQTKWIYNRFHIL